MKKTTARLIVHKKTLLLPRQFVIYSNLYYTLV